MSIQKVNSRKMTGLSPIQKLDAVLSVLATGTRKDFQTLEIEEMLETRHIRIPQNEISKICQKLDKDGMAVYTEGRMVESVQITFDGMVLLETGGYAETAAKAHYQFRKVEALQKDQRLQRRWITLLTIILAISSLLAALYYATELYWKHGWFHFLTK